MPNPDLSQTIAFETPHELNQWLKSNHNTNSELWIKVFKKGTGTPSVTWNDIVIQALCWGWIDGIKKSIDDTAYLQRITPRKARSVWSKKNRDHAETLISSGDMQEAGLAQVRAAKADGRWESAYVASEMEVPQDFIAALETKHDAQQFYQTLTKTNRYVIALGLTSAKKPETRQRRFDKYMEQLTNQTKPT